MIGEDMTLDAATANSLLVPSDDPREVHCGEFRHHPREDPQRFASMACVLGTPCFSSGPHYWEVDVEEGKEWAPGLCQEPVDRRRKSGSSERGFWVISVKAGAIHSSGIRRPGSRKPWPQPERLFLDVHTEGIRFFDVRNDALIYMHSNFFWEPLPPFFCPELPGEEDSWPTEHLLVRNSQCSLCHRILGLNLLRTYSNLPRLV